MRKYLLFIILTWHFFSAFSQTNPVQVITTVMPPYSTLLSEYYTGDLPRLSVLLLNKDFNEPFMQVHLRMTIEGQGVKMQSNPYGNYPAIDLSPGAPVTVSQGDLAPYFSAQNLQVGTGGSKLQGRLPEGYYQFCFEAIEKLTNRVVGTKQCANAFLTLSDPPFLTLPEKGKAVSSANPFNLLFQWTPRHLGNPNAINTEYEFSLVEIWDNGITPEAAFYTAQPVYTTKLTTPNLFYGPGEPLLITGKTYAWRIKTTVSGSSGAQEPFKNNGYSEIFWFKLQGDCPLVQNAQIVINPKTNKADFTWTTDPSQVGSYHLDYRKKGDNKWNTVDAQTNKTSLSGLKWDTDYEYRMGTRCVITDDFLYGNNQTFRTLKQDTASCNATAQPALTNREPINTLKSTDTIYASGFRMRLTKVSGSNGTFSGEGYLALMVPTTTTEVSVKARFTNIRVNTDKQLFEGKIVSIYDANEGGISKLDIDKGGTKVGNVKTGGTSITTTVKGTIDPGKTATVTSVINTKGDTTYTVTLTGTDGKAIIVKTDKLPATIQDKDGNLYVVHKNGVLTKVGGVSSLLAGKTTDELNQLQLDKGKVTFEASKVQQYDFDAYNKLYDKSILFSTEYESLAEGKYRVANKLLITQSTDKVNARISNLAKGINADSIHFVTGKGIEFISKKIEEGLYEINLLSGPAGDAQELYAVYRDNKAIKANTDPKVNMQNFTYSFGKLKIATYEPKTLSVKLVPIGDAEVNTGQIETKLNEVYNKVGISWKVSEAEPFTDMSWDSDGDKKLNITGAGKYNKYSDEMKLLNEAYKPLAEENPDIPHLFVFENSPLSDDKGRAVLGDMLRNKQFGYIFKEKNDDLGLTAAHELGHGMFHLSHTFDDQYHLKEGELGDNLMDYSSGTKLVKLQWDAIYDPGLVIGVFEDEGDGAVKAANLMTVQICDSITKLNKIYYEKTGCKLFVNIANGDTSIKSATVNLEITPTNSKTKIKKVFTITKFNVKLELSMDSLAKGKYLLSYKLGKQTNNHNFYYQKNKHEYACIVCGRDLKLSHEELKKIFDGSELIEDHPNVADIFNKAISHAKLNTCYNQAHFLSQMKHESDNMKVKVEDRYYTVQGILETHYNKPYTKDVLYKQSFWDDRDYLNYALSGLSRYQKDSLSKSVKYKANSQNTYTYSKTTNRVKIEYNFEKSLTGKYIKTPSLTESEKSAIEKRYFNLVYAGIGGNGDIASNEGYKYRGRGAIQLTGKSSYKGAADECKDKFGLTYDWLNNPDVLLKDSNYDQVIYSAIGFFLWKFQNPDVWIYLNSNNVKKVTLFVNGGYKGLDDRKNEFKNLIDIKYSNCTPNNK